MQGQGQLKGKKQGFRISRHRLRTFNSSGLKISINTPKLKEEEPVCILCFPRTAGGGGYPPPPPVRFFADSEKTAARSAAKIFIAVQPTIWHIKKARTGWPQRSRLQATLSDLTSSCIFQSLRACQRHIEDPNSLKLAVCNTDIVSTICISRIFLDRWHQVMSFSWPPHYNESMIKNEVPLMRIRSDQITQNHNQVGYAWYPRHAVASFPRWKVIWGHIMASSGRQRFFANNFWQKWARDMGLVPQCSSCQGASTNMQHDLLRWHCDLDLAWPGVKF